MRSPARFVLVAMGVGALGVCSHGGEVRPDDDSVLGHRQQAARERAVAAEDRQRVAPPGGGLPPGTVPDPSRPFPDGVPAPSPEADEARWHLEHARQHEAAAHALERFEAAECAGIDGAQRRGCPLLGPVIGIEDLPAGVRVVLGPTTSAEEVARHMRCHYAFARARGFSPEAAACPLYVRGIEISVAPGNAVQILGPNPAVAREIQRRARQQMVRAPSTRPPS